jgi:hypothetical protein
LFPFYATFGLNRNFLSDYSSFQLFNTFNLFITFEDNIFYLFFDLLPFTIINKQFVSITEEQYCILDTILFSRNIKKSKTQLYELVNMLYDENVLGCNIYDYRQIPSQSGLILPFEAPMPSVLNDFVLTYADYLCNILLSPLSLLIV